MTIPQSLRDEVSKGMEAAGIPVPNSPERWAKAEEALKGVWASKYNDRAYYSLRKVRQHPSDGPGGLAMLGSIPGMAPQLSLDSGWGAW